MLFPYQSCVRLLFNIVVTSLLMRSGGGLVMLLVPLPVISRSLLLTCDRPSTCPTSCAIVHCVAPWTTQQDG